MQVRPSSSVPRAVHQPLKPVAGPAPTAGAAAPAAPGLAERLKGLASGVATFVRHLFQPSGTWHNPAAPALPDRGGLKLMTYNVMVKMTHAEAVEADIRRADPDVVALQETSEAAARAVAEHLGMHLAWQDDPLHAYGGTAVLSKYPIEAAEDFKLINPWKDRLGELWRSLKTGRPRMAALDSRHLTHATLRVGTRTVEVFNGHLTVFGAATNAKQIAQITALAKAAEKRGSTVVLTGDWNANFAPGPAPGSHAPTAGEAAIAGLRAGFCDFWDAETRTVLVGGQLITPEQALAELQRGGLDPTSERYAQLRRAAAGGTLPGSAKRFDNIFASKDTRFVSAHIDQTTRASDHQPAMAELRWD